MMSNYVDIKINVQRPFTDSGKRSWKNWKLAFWEDFHVTNQSEYYSYFPLTFCLMHLPAHEASNISSFISLILLSYFVFWDRVSCWHLGWPRTHSSRPDSVSWVMRLSRQEPWCPALSIYILLQERGRWRDSDNTRQLRDGAKEVMQPNVRWAHVKK